MENKSGIFVLNTSYAYIFIRKIFTRINILGKLRFTSLERRKPFASRKNANGLGLSRDENHLHVFCLQMVYLSQ